MTDNDHTLWSYIARSIKKIDKSDIASPVYDEADPFVKESKPKRSDAGASAEQNISRSISEETTTLQINDMTVSVNQPFQLDRKTDDRLRKGKMPIDVRLDLHGLRAHEAHKRLKSVILKAFADQNRIVLVITGKGSRSESGIGVIKSSFPTWMADPALSDKVLKYYPAQRKHGGDGAYYVYLRRKR